MDIYHFVDEVSSLARDFAYLEQDTYPAEDVRMTFVEWLPLFLKFLDEAAGGTAGGLTATSPEFKEFLKSVKPWNGPLPGGWR